MPQLSALTSFELELPDQLQSDLEKYMNQGALLGIFTYFLTYLETADEDVAGTAASIPTCLFVTSSLHDDAIDEAIEHEKDLKEFLNLQTTVGDMIFTYVIDFAGELPNDFDIGVLTEQFREIGVGQLREEALTSADLTAEQAIARVEERGSVWGELAISPVEASGHYSDAQLNRIYTFVGNLLFILTVVDDVEDIPEDVDNDVRNIPLILHQEDPSDHASMRSLIDSLLESDVPSRLEDLIAQREAKIEDAARQFQRNTQHGKADLLDAWNRSLVWYIESACTIPVEQNVPPDRQEEVRSKLAGDDETKRRYLLEEIVADFPARFESGEEFVASMSSLPATSLAPAAIKMFHIEALIDSVMTTTLEDALATLQAESTAAQ